MCVQASLVLDYVHSPHCHSGLHTLVHFVGAAPGSANIVASLRRICQELSRRLSLPTDVPEEYK